MAKRLPIVELPVNTVRQKLNVSFDEMCRAKLQGLAFLPALRLHAAYLHRECGEKATVPLEDYERVISLLEDAINAIPVVR